MALFFSGGFFIPLIFTPPFPLPSDGRFRGVFYAALLGRMRSVFSYLGIPRLAKKLWRVAAGKSWERDLKYCTALNEKSVS